MSCALGLAIALISSAIGQKAASAPSVDAKSLDKFLFQYEVQAEELRKPIIDLGKLYEGKLDALGKKQQSAGNLDALLITKEEKENFRTNDWVVDGAGDDLLKVRKIYETALSGRQQGYEKALAALSAKYAPDFGNLVAMLTRSGEVKAAKRARDKQLEFEKLSKISASSIVAGSIPKSKTKPGVLHVWGKQNMKGRLIPIAEPSASESQGVVRVEFEGFRGYWHAIAESGKLITSGWPEDAVQAKGTVRNVVDLAGGNTIAAAVRENGELVFWGFDIESKAGKLEGLKNVAAVEIGNGFTFAMKKDGEVVYHAQKTTASHLTAPGPDFLKNARFISCGLGIAFVQKKDNTAYIWTGKSPDEKIKFPKGKRVKNAEFSGRQGLILLEDGKVIPYGELTHPMPKRFTNIKAVRVADHVFAVQRDDDTWFAWGENVEGVVDKINSIGKAKDLAILVLRNQKLVSLAWIE